MDPAKVFIRQNQSSCLVSSCFARLKTMFRASLLPTSASTSSSRSSSLRCGPPLTDASAAGLSASAVPPAGTAAAAAAIPRLSWR